MQVKVQVKVHVKIQAEAKVQIEAQVKGYFDLVYRVYSLGYKPAILNFLAIEVCE